MFRYETHLHTFPVSKCARASVEDTLLYYRSLNYDGVFITNHFLDGNLNVDRALPYEDRLSFFFSDYEKGLELAPSIGIRVFLGVEMSYKGTDFLVYGIPKEWYFEHPEIMEISMRERLALLDTCGALIIQAHPFREAGYIDHIRLFPRSVHGIEAMNACRTDFENKLAEQYANNYGLLHFAGTDNHVGGAKSLLAGMGSDTSIRDELDFVSRVKKGEMFPFVLDTEATAE